MFPPRRRVHDRRAATRTSPTAGTRSSTSSTRSGVRFAHEVHPREIAYDYWTAVRTLEAIGHRPAFGLNFDPVALRLAGPRPGRLPAGTSATGSTTSTARTSKRQIGNGRNGRLGSHLPWADPRRGWDFVSTGHGDVPWEAVLPHAELHRLRRAHLASSGRTPAWTGSSAHPRHCSSSARLALRPARGRLRRRLLH